MKWNSKGFITIFTTLFMILYLMAPSAASAQMSPSLWSAVNTGTRQDIVEVCYGDGIFMMAGDGGYIGVSSDGLNWTPMNTGITEDLYGVCHGKAGFMAAGCYQYYLSADRGVTWTAHTLPHPSAARVKALILYLQAPSRFRSIPYQQV